MALLGMTRSKRPDGADTVTTHRAQERAHRMPTPDLNLWAEGVAMNLQANVTGFIVSRNPDCINEALVMCDSLKGMLTELAERVV